MLYPKDNGKKPNPNFIPPASKFEKILCKHEDSEVVCWHWTHGFSTYEIRFLEIQFKCNCCGRYYFKAIRDWNECDKFIANHGDKQWSDACKPVL